MGNKLHESTGTSTPAAKQASLPRHCQGAQQRHLHGTNVFPDRFITHVLAPILNLSLNTCRPHFIGGGGRGRQHPVPTRDI
ncbi:hypothetical protein E2C01_024709 [Portunus trituberculatus]|uniref:Uncharacterized protein n=1 Tax=Portunus trituberculatus TaxID=210409 RepID=A0A5B7EB13_PORTR|nr:hypothetical protein [Portunus trituberculatus]